jgi:hypothetical protein
MIDPQPGPTFGMDFMAGRNTISVSYSNGEATHIPLVWVFENKLRARNKEIKMHY